MRLCACELIFVKKLTNETQEKELEKEGERETKCHRIANHVLKKEQQKKVAFIVIVLLKQHNGKIDQSKLKVDKISNAFVTHKSQVAERQTRNRSYSKFRY